MTLRLTLPEKPLRGVTVTAKLTVDPRCTVWGDGAEIVKDFLAFIPRLVRSARCSKPKLELPPGRRSTPRVPYCEPVPCSISSTAGRSLISR